MGKYIKSPMNYTGGKYKLLPQILPLFPKDVNTFFDLFTGGANVAVNVDAKTIIANDIEKNIIGIYNMFQQYDINGLIESIEEIIKDYELSITNADGFNNLRKLYNNVKLGNCETSYDLHVLLFVLICYSFNHQFRFNSKGEFNMPFGKNRSQWNNSLKNNLINFHKSITEKNIRFIANDSNDFLNNGCVGKDDFVYCDPPYLITCATYNEQNGWNERKECELLSLLDRLNSNGIRFALSNVLYSKGKENRILKEWSSKYNVYHLDYTYQNCNYHTKDKSNKADEVLVTNYL